jgi:hypothetical protein
MSGEYNPSPEGNPSLLVRRNRFQTALVKFIGKRTPKCREVVRILSQSVDSKLSLTEWKLQTRSERISAEFAATL